MLPAHRVSLRSSEAGLRALFRSTGKAIVPMDSGDRTEGAPTDATVPANRRM
jgi:hypothetical protein